jgi:hypothetical protein
MGANLSQPPLDRNPFAEDSSEDDAMSPIPVLFSKTVNAVRSNLGSTRKLKRKEPPTPFSSGVLATSPKRSRAAVVTPSLSSAPRSVSRTLASLWSAYPSSRSLSPDDGFLPSANDELISQVMYEGLGQQPTRWEDTEELPCRQLFY